ncbi:IclR family transcriptional regulator [Halovenus marina]|jgi:DNA-binding IclR family transcriptional regulator|uniref:IclR family transcriptional regulator n=1 Tax=Halovenus marina TaxID=3396621 RepID=UPI003F5617ED
MARKAKHPVQTTQKSLDIIEALSELGSAGVTELAEELGMNKSIVHNHLRTLEERGFVIVEDEQYSLGLRFFQLGGKERRDRKIYQIAKNEIDKTASEIEASVNLAVEENGKCVYLYRACEDRSIDLEFSYEGMYEHMHQTAVGKAIMAYLPQERVEEIVERHGLPQRTEHTITNFGKLMEDLTQIRERGYAIDDEESILGLRCVAAPIKTNEGEIIGSISISGPKSRFKNETWSQELPEKVRDASNVIELQFVGRN